MTFPFRLHYTCLVTVLSSICLVAPSNGFSQSEGSKEVESKVISVSLFKNGLSVVKRLVPLTARSAHLSDVPEPVHGTFFIESKGPLEARVESRNVPSTKQATWGKDLHEELAGQRVSIFTKSSNAPFMGVVVASSKVDEETTMPRILPSDWSAAPTNASGRYLVLKTERGVAYIDVGEIALVEAEWNPTPKPAMEKRSVLVLESGEKTIGDSAQISYLTHGISWAPNYRVVLLDTKRMSIEQNAVIRNEWMDLNETDVSLISGYPSVPFGHVISPLAATQSWSKFFQQLSNRSGDVGLSNSVLTQNAFPGAGGNRRGSWDGAGPSVAPNSGDAIDLHYQSIGKRSLKKGDSLVLSSGTAQVDYERVVQWTIPDNRNEWGSPISQPNMDPYSGEPLQDDVWDALNFKNAFSFPMTSAPVVVVSGESFSGQGQVLWTNKNEMATVRVNKALSIRARHVEYENRVGEPAVAERDVFNIGGSRFRRATVNGELRLSNNRSTEVKMIIKRQFSGDYVKGDESPKIDLREEGIWTINKRNQLQWTLVLKPSEEKTIQFQYTVLIQL